MSADSMGSAPDLILSSVRFPVPSLFLFQCMSADTRESPQQREADSSSAEYKPVFDSSEVPALETIFSLCASAVSGNAGARNQGSQAFSVCLGSSFGYGPNWQPLPLSSSCMPGVGKSACYIYMVAERSGCGR